MLSDKIYWLVGDQRYYSQIEAWQAIERTGAEARFCLFEEAYDQHDWSKEPPESWEELVRLRCLQLRLKYKNLKLLFSGGRDSSFVLKSFIVNQIPLDELLIVHYRENPVRSHEFLTWIQPNAERYRQFNPKVKITTLTVDFKDYADWYSEDWSEQRRATTMYGMFQPSDYTWMIQRQLGVEHSNTGIINGLDKPMLRAEGNNVYSTLKDHTYLHYFNNPDIMEFFYFTPDMPELHIKQCHMCMNYLAQHYPDKPVEFLKQFNEKPNEYYDEFCISVGRGPAIDVNNPAQNGKNKYNGSHPVFKILAKLVKNSEQHRAWDRYQENVRWIQDHAPSAFYDVNDPVHWGHRMIFGKNYFIRKWHQND